MKHLSLILALLLSFGLLAAEQINVGVDSNEIRLIQAQPDNMILELTLSNFNAETIQIDGETYYDLSIKKAGLTLEQGLPQLPIMAASVIIPNSAKMKLEVLDSQYVDLDMKVAPSKGNLTRDIDPNSVAYSFDPFYQGDSAWPNEQTELSEPFILRDYRGITVRFIPFSYYPATSKLRVYTKIKVSLSQIGTDFSNSLSSAKNSYSREFEDIYQNMFLNFGMAKYPSLDESGRILVIKHDMFDSAIIPWVEWKRQNGYQVDVVDVSVAGPTANNIKTYIQNQYNLNDGLMFVQIMGDAPQVPSLSSGGGGSDPSYALLAGNDNYPDIYVSRFSAENVSEMQIQVQKTVEYERDRSFGSPWLQKAMGIASNEGGGGQGDNGESDQQHMEIIRGKLLNYGYTSVDQMYQASGATASQVSTNLNAGRAFINYVGHGSDTSWVTTGFNNNNVNALTNDHMLPFIMSVACVNGNFVSRTCFAEAWLRAKNPGTGAPTGAVGMYASTINQGWNPPMRAQDEVTDLLVAEAKSTLGGLYFNSSSKMIEVYGTSGASEYKCWTIFGDASMMVRTKDPIPMSANYMDIIFLGMESFTVSTVPGARVTLYADGQIFAHGIANAAGIAELNLDILPEEPMDLTLTITAFNYQTLVDTIQVLPSDGAYLLVMDMLVNDDNNNIPEYGETITLHFELNNVGSEPAEGVVMSLSSDSQYINIQNSQDNLGDIDAEGFGSTAQGFEIQIANNVPDQHAAALEILITTENGEAFSYSRNLLISAPHLEFGQVSVDDFMGNQNQALDPGETVILNFPILNTGSAQANDLNGFMVVNNVTHVADQIDIDFNVLPANGQVEMSYVITFSSQVPQGTMVSITTMVFSGEYSAAKTYSISLGKVMENFENGFNQFPWTFSNGEWTPAAGASYNNSMAAKSPTISHNQSTSMTVTVNSESAGVISFWKKVSSENNYDFLKFYINGILKEQWSGTNDVWSQVTYNTESGRNTFKWEYVKDSMTSSGQDCAWIDDIAFPTTGGILTPPCISVDESELDFGQLPLGESLVLPLTINNLSSSVLIGTAQTNSPFSLVDAVGEEQILQNVVVQAESFIQLNVKFTPSRAGEFAESLIITTDDVENPTLIIELTGSANPVANDENVQQLITSLKGNYPNPFNPSTTIRYSLKESGKVKIEIYNLKGQLVKTLINQTMPKGEHQINWNAKDDRGNKVSSGIYLYKMKVGNYNSTNKMMLMK